MDKLTTKAKQENPWRVAAPVLHNGKYGSVIIDRGQLKKALPSSTNLRHVFDDTANGARSVIIVGTALQIFDYLLSHQNHGIESRIKSLPDIYMGIAPFKPKDRFTASFPIGDALVNVVSYFASVIPVPDWVTLAASPTSLDAMKKSILGLSPAETSKGAELYVKFSYLKEDGMQKVATKDITFKQVAEAIQQRYKKP